MAVAAEVTAGARQERGWRKLLFALGAFLLVYLYPPLGLLLPVTQTLVLLVPAIAACALAGWWAGGRFSLAAFWTVMAVGVLVYLPDAGPEFGALVRGWSLALAGAFGLVCVLSAQRTFFVRAVTAVAIAGALGTVAATAAPSGASRVTSALNAELGRRSTFWSDQLALSQQSQDPVSRALRARATGDELRTVPRWVSDETAVTLFPALLALESLAALGLAWSLYHRFSRVRIGLPIAPLREFRFNDQLVWGLVAGLAFVLLETLAGLKAPGLNMLVFFGALYALRGTGVLAWFLAPDRLVMVPLFLFALLAWQLFGAVALGLGLGDTWLDWRSRAARPAA